MNESEQAYMAVIGPIEDRMTRAIWRIVRNGQDAEDALQNALLTIWNRWDRVRRHANPQALVLKICIDAAYDIHRRHARGRLPLDLSSPREDRAASPRLPSDEVADRELLAEVLAAIHRLSRQQAVAVTLRVIEDLPYDEIAAAMGCTQATARKHVARAREHLRIMLARHEPNRIQGS